MVELTEKNLIGKIKELRQIKPRKDWVCLTKTQILGEEPTFFLFPYFKPASVGLIAIFILFGLFGFAKNSLPGDPLYTIRKIVHESRAVFVSPEEKPVFQLKLANDRLKDLTKAPAKNLAPTINEFQASISEAAKDLTKVDATTSNPIVTQKIVDETKKLKENEEKMRSLGVVIEGEEIENFNKAVVEYLIKDLEGMSLTEEKEIILKEMKKLFEEGKYSEALELYLINQ